VVHGGGKSSVVEGQRQVHRTPMWQGRRHCRRHCRRPLANRCRLWRGRSRIPRRQDTAREWLHAGRTVLTVVVSSSSVVSGSHRSGAAARAADQQALRSAKRGMPRERNSVGP
jgi:hypothetical protein